MKRIIVLGLLLTFLLTGCGNNGKEIHCAYYEESDDIKITYDYLMKYDKTGENLKTMQFTTTLSGSEISEVSSQVDTLCDSYETEEFKDLVKCSVKQKGDSIEVILEIQIEKLSEEQKEAFMESDFDMSYEEVKQNYESADYEQEFCTFDSNKKLVPVLYDGGILGILSNSNKSSAENSAYGIIKAAESFVATYMLENNGDFPGKLTFICDGSSCVAKLNGSEEKLDFKGTVPTSGSIYVSESGEASIKDDLVINGYTCTMDDDEVTCEK